MRESKNDKDVARIYMVLGHPLRRDIINLLGEKKQVGFTDLKATLKVSIGTLYYNIDLLEDLVEQDKNKKYILTSKGQIAYRLMLESEEKLDSLGIEEKSAGWTKIVYENFFMRRLFNYLYVSTKLSFPSALIIILYGTWITYQAQLFPIFFVYSDKLVSMPIYASVLFLLSWVFINFFGNFIPWIIYRRPLKESVDCMLVGSCYVFLPSLILPTIWTIYHFLDLQIGLVEAQIIMLLSAGYSLCLFTTAVAMAKGLRMEKAGLVTLIILYLTLVLAYI